MLMFALGAIVIVIGLLNNHQDFANSLFHKTGQAIQLQPAKFKWTTFLSGSALLFSSFIGFDSIAQAGGEGKPRQAVAASNRHLHPYRYGFLFCVHLCRVSHHPMELCRSGSPDNRCHSPGFAACRDAGELIGVRHLWRRNCFIQ